ncbi:ornithine carbamoyltransferase [Thiohalorhabdus denitrificans]|uniref:Ornithine carbamoyltransferase n=1 Tax=Thiohalorhabdus denitrificans TaxID=381306 RepID=A0A0P9EBD0_9GAMM|nr:ornithine carbamoyltransferase [Thiohalorhabdus denitrificans]KPV39584.1 ornithine carbamoyltransferase [Thiohalorhabdus denitrificans]SCX97752.1 ornithine carbamoyltransferase [Thiohalorhabdus denitrificans]
MSPRHFLRLDDLGAAELEALLARAAELKAERRAGQGHPTLAGKVMGLLFEKPSTRTRVSFESGIYQLGGYGMFLSQHDLQLGRGEPIADTAEVVSRMVDGIMIRTFGHERIAEFAAASHVPVINGLTDRFHPCQVLTDLFTWYERRGSIAGRTVAWIGDGNNMAHSWINAARLLGFELRIASPEGFDPEPDLVAAAGDRVTVLRDPKQAAAGADIVTTDVWASMGQEEEQAERERAFGGYRVDAALMEEAKPDALFMHCLPAHRGEEVTAEVLEGPQSVVWEEAENRLHAQKALMELLLG